MPEHELSAIAMYEERISQLSFDTIMESESGYQFMLKFCNETDKTKLLILWKYCCTFRDLSEKLTSIQLRDSVQAIADDCFADKLVQTTSQKACDDVVVKLKQESELKADLFDNIKTQSFDALASQFEKFKTTKWCQQYVTKITSLIDLIDDDHAMLYFDIFLANEYSSESLDFYRAVKLARQRTFVSCSLLKNLHYKSISIQKCAVRWKSMC